jgi:hypothetical protein
LLAVLDRLQISPETSKPGNERGHQGVTPAEAAVACSLTLLQQRVTYRRDSSRISICSLFLTKTHLTKVGKMGAILDLVEKMRSPMGIVVTIAIIAIGVFFIRWVFSDHDKQ